MPMGIVSNSDFEKERTKLESSIDTESVSPNQKPTGIIKDVTRGRPTDAVEVPNGLRKLIGEESAINGRNSALELAQSLGISPSSVSAYQQGATSTASYNETPNKPHIDSAKERVSNRARARLMSALRHITEDKLEGSRPRDLAGIARDMSAIIKNMEPETPVNSTGGKGGPTFIFYSPQTRKEEYFDIVQVTE
jgi:predicted transcriptional regulator